ncbi:MAG: hypothetical protein WAK20_05040 [Candidatus Acidiferrum sp.]
MSIWNDAKEMVLELASLKLNAANGRRDTVLSCGRLRDIFAKSWLKPLAKGRVWEMKRNFGFGLNLSNS